MDGFWASLWLSRASSYSQLREDKLRRMECMDQLRNYMWLLHFSDGCGFQMLWNSASDASRKTTARWRKVSLPDGAWLTFG